MKKKTLLSRRSVLQTAGLGMVGAWVVPALAADKPQEELSKPKGNIKQSICQWCYGSIPLEKLAAEAARFLARGSFDGRLGALSAVWIALTYPGAAPA